MIPIPDGWSTMTSIDKTLHHNLRRVFRSGVTADCLAAYEPAILRNLDVYFSEINKVQDSKGWSTAADMRAWSELTNTTFDIQDTNIFNPDLCLGFDTMADFGLGLKTNLLRSPAKDYVFPALHVHEKKMGLWEQLPILNDIGIGDAVSRVLLFLSPKAKLFADWYSVFLNEAITNNTAKSRGIFGPVIQSGQGLLEKPGHNYAQMIGEGAFSTFSSSDAYGMMLSGFTHYLSHYPHVYEKLATEMRAMYKPGEKITWGPQLESNAYLRAVIDEVMRMLPPACGVHWRECERAGVTIGPNGFPMPVGADVGMSLFSLFRDGRVFRNPVQFWPERWIPGTLPEQEQKMARKMFTPFLIGPRNCAGGHVAIMIASIAFTHLIVNYDFRLDSEKQNHKAPSHVWTNAPDEVGADKELRFESHYSIAGWHSGPFIQFKSRE